ncbi:MAG: Flp family type IVb pilin [Brevundimonas sp.]|nr:Flp family type IVb pilin [Brevundimonas sp.]MDO9077968.1 Flp family type IVb pilin [Brevundimonas sp.]MDP3081883.1 Flp family type IVb pilin [Brevundimonas sp.]MDZ4060197.1 Flp family type IVb pilin [Brevundimonas sp.]
MRRFLCRFARDESGATAIEYGMILALMFLVILGALQAFGGTGSGIFNTAMDKLRTAMGG